MTEPAKAYDPWAGTLTVGDLREALAALPDDAGIICEDVLGWKYSLRDARAIGMRTDDPGLVLKLRNTAYRPLETLDSL